MELVNYVGYCVNEDNGATIGDLYYGMQEYDSSGKANLLSDIILMCFEKRIPIQLSDYGMPKGIKDVNECMLYIQNMGFELYPLDYMNSKLSPWADQYGCNDLFFLRSWEPGANVNPYGYWSKIEMSTDRSQQVEHISKHFERYDKFDFDKSLDANDGIYDQHHKERLVETDNWKDGREKDGLYSIDEGKKFSYIEHNEMIIGDMSYSIYPKVIKSAENVIYGQAKNKRKRNRK